MATYSAYLETGDSGTCMAHVLHPSGPIPLGSSLPGCFARADDRETALRRVPAAVREYMDWLCRHGETDLPKADPIQIELAGESHGMGPFNPGDAAALFAPDIPPITHKEMERYFRLMAYARADLLAVFVDESLKSDEVLDWQPNAQAFSIRHTLRHVGNAEEWYVSRLLPPERLPPEWEHDDALPLFDFLKMERRTALDRLRRLTDAERSEIFHPVHWTQHPEEAWTARKVLRRFVEHEREHTGQVKELLLRS